MDDSADNIFAVLQSPSSSKSLKLSPHPSNIGSLRRSRLALINAGDCLFTGSAMATSSPVQRRQTKRTIQDRGLQGLGFANPGPKNLVNLANVPTRRLKSRQAPVQEKPSSTSSKPMYDRAGRLVSNQVDRCDCNRLPCPGCFVPCTSCQSPKCGLECRNSRTYTYEYRLYGTNTTIAQQ